MGYKPNWIIRVRRKLARRLARRNESGQSTTEYILILAAVVMVASKFGPQLKKIVDGVVNKTEKQIESTNMDTVN